MPLSTFFLSFSFSFANSSENIFRVWFGYISFLTHQFPLHDLASIFSTVNFRSARQFWLFISAIIDHRETFVLYSLIRVGIRVQLEVSSNRRSKAYRKKRGRRRDDGWLHVYFLSSFLLFLVLPPAGKPFLSRAHFSSARTRHPHTRCHALSHGKT